VPETARVSGRERLCLSICPSVGRSVCLACVCARVRVSVCAFGGAVSQATPEVCQEVCQRCMCVLARVGREMRGRPQAVPGGRGRPQAFPGGRAPSPSPPHPTISLPLVSSRRATRRGGPRWSRGWCSRATSSSRSTVGGRYLLTGCNNSSLYVALRGRR